MIRIAPILVLVAVLSGQVTAADGEQRNVIVFVVDDMGFQAGCYGNTVIQTPGIDRLAASGTVFTRAHCTTASCSASRSVLMTGLHNHATGHFGHAHGYNHFSTYESVRSLPVMLAESGYRTCSIGKYHLAPDYVYEFQEYRNQEVQGNRNAVRMAQNAKEWILEDDDRPFFLYFCTSDPHRGGGADGFSNFNDDPDRYPGVRRITYRPEDVVVPPWLPDKAETRGELAEFYQAISRLDQGLSLLLDTLEETGHRNDTLIIFLSDNGPPFPGAKTCLYQPAMNLPLIVRCPGVPVTGIRTDALVTWSDVTPTVLDYCRVTPRPAPQIRPRENRGSRIEDGPHQPVRFHGRSFLAAVSQEHVPNFNAVFASHTFHEITMYYPMRVLIEGRYKYIFNIAHQLPYPFASDLHRSPTWQAVLRDQDELYGRRPVSQYLHRPRHELYDLQADPHEIKNLAGSPNHQERLKAMQQKVRDWQKSTNDPWRLKWEYE